MQINRLFEIVYILLGKKSITANELAESFGADVEVLAPQNIRNRLQKEIEKINMIYAKIT